MDKNLYWYHAKLVLRRENAVPLEDTTTSVLKKICRYSRRVGDNSWRVTKNLSALACCLKMPSEFFSYEIKRLQVLGFIADVTDVGYDQHEITLTIPAIPVVSQAERARRRKEKGYINNINIPKITPAQASLKNKKHSAIAREDCRNYEARFVDCVLFSFNEKCGTAISAVPWVTQKIKSVKNQYFPDGGILQYITDMVVNPLTYGNGYSFFRWLFSREQIENYLSRKKDKQKSTPDYCKCEVALKEFNKIFDCDVEMSDSLSRRLWQAIKQKFKTLNNFFGFLRRMRKKFDGRNPRRFLNWILFFGTISQFFVPEHSAVSIDTPRIENFRTTFEQKCAEKMGNAWCMSWLGSCSISEDSEKNTVTIMCPNNFIRDKVDVAVSFINLNMEINYE